MLTGEDPFGGDIKTCSYSAAFMAENAETLVAQGMTEAQFSGAQAKGQLGVMFAKAAKGEIPKYAKVFEGESDAGDKWFAVYKGLAKFGKSEVHTFDLTKTTKSGKVYHYSFGEKTAFVQQIMEEGKFKFGTASKPTVSAGPSTVKASVGAMSDEDASTLFVVIKDQLAKEKGLNIKGANPELDALVYKEIGERIGYTAVEVKSKIEAYKATGKKLSALKKKTLKDKPKIPPKPKPVTVPDEIVVEQVKQAPDPFPEAVQYLLDDWDVAVKNGEMSISDLQEVAASNLSQKTVQSAQKWLTKEGLEWKPKPEKVSTPPLSAEPNGVPTQATQQVVDDVVDAMDTKGLSGVYTIEDKAAQYVMAKDAVVAQSNGKWTLYTKSPEMEQAIFDMIKETTGLEPFDVQEGIKDYLASGKKLSMLKKQLIKTGAMEKKAPTLKGGTKATSANVKSFADKGFVPKDAKPVNLGASLMESQKEHVFKKFKQNGSVYLDKPPATLYESAVQTAKDINESGWLPDEVSPLDVIRFVDEFGTKKLGFAENKRMYEQKVVAWAASGEGKAFIQAKLEAEKLLANMPPLPADSKLFQIIETYQAQKIQDRLEPWTAAQREALRTYTGGAYGEMNRWLRGDRKGYISSSLRQAVDDGIAGMRAVDEEFLVRRGTSFHQFEVDSYEQIVALIGQTTADKGFLSTSVGGEAAFGGSVKMEIEIVKGTKGAYVQSISHFSHEREFIVAPGTKMKILRVENHGYQTVVRLRTIP